MHASALILFSGGQDSTTWLRKLPACELRRRGYEEWSKR